MQDYRKTKDMTLSSPFLKARAAYLPRFPKVLDNPAALRVVKAGLPNFVADAEQKAILKNLFSETFDQELLKLEASDSPVNTKKLTIGVVLSGGQAPGGHNVICGLFDALKLMNPDSKLIGFNSGPGGILADKYIEISKEFIDEYRNTGGFDMLGSGRTKIETAEQFTLCRKTLDKHRADALVIIGGDDSNTNAALLANYFRSENSPIQIIGVPKTIDGDLKNQYVETSFGFDTAVRLYSELISNISRDALSAKKYYHFIRLMGRSASHITLEAAFQTQPNIVLIGEEIAQKNMSLKDIVAQMAETVIERSKNGKHYGIVLVPEGIIEFIPEIQQLILELNDIIADHKEYFESLDGFSHKSEWTNKKLSRDASYTFSGLPIDIQREFLMERDPHGNIQVSLIETEKLLIELLTDHLAELKTEGNYSGKFKTQGHFLGYEGRCAAPTNFDADYAYSLGRTAVALVSTGVTGYMATVKNLASDRNEWEAMGVPLVSMMNLEVRQGTHKPVIKKGLVALGGKPLAHLNTMRKQWAEQDSYRFAGSIQYFGPKDLCDRVPYTLALEQNRTEECCW